MKKFLINKKGAYLVSLNKKYAPMPVLIQKCYKGDFSLVNDFIWSNLRDNYPPKVIISLIDLIESPESLADSILYKGYIVCTFNGREPVGYH